MNKRRLWGSIRLRFCILIPLNSFWTLPYETKNAVHWCGIFLKLISTWNTFPHFNNLIKLESFFRSLNIFFKDDDRLTFHRHAVAQSTDCIRGKARLYLFFVWFCSSSFMFCLSGIFHSVFTGSWLINERRVAEADVVKSASACLAPKWHQRMTGRVNEPLRPSFLIFLNCLISE